MDYCRIFHDLPVHVILKITIISLKSLKLLWNISRRTKILSNAQYNLGIFWCILEYFATTEKLFVAKLRNKISKDAYDIQEQKASRSQTFRRAAYRRGHTPQDCHRVQGHRSHRHHRDKMFCDSRGPGSHGMNQMVLLGGGRQAGRVN